MSASRRKSKTPATPGGHYILKFHKGHYETLKNNGGFEGINAKPTEANGILILRLTEVEMKQFNDNQDKINQEGDDSISVSLQASTSCDEISVLRDY